MRFFLFGACVRADAATLFTFLLLFGLLRSFEALLATFGDVRSFCFLAAMSNLLSGWAASYGAAGTSHVRTDDKPGALPRASASGGDAALEPGRSTMAWKRLLTDDDLSGLAAPSATIGGAAVPGVATTDMRSDAAPGLGPLTRDLDFDGFKATKVADPAGAQGAATKACMDALAQGLAPKESVQLPRATQSRKLSGGERALSFSHPALAADESDVAQRAAVTVRGESSSHREPRRLLIRALAGERVSVRIHNPKNTSGMECVLERSVVEDVSVCGPRAATSVVAADGHATVQLAVRWSRDAYLWIHTAGDEGWDIVVTQAQLARALGVLARL